MRKPWFSSFYIKIFLTFLVTCILFFVGLAVFWNYYFTDLFYKDKKEMLSSRFGEVAKLLPSIQEGTISTREMRFGVRIIARSINGQVWLVDSSGMILNGSSEREGTLIPKVVDTLFIDGLKGQAGFVAGEYKLDERARGGTLTYYAPSQLNGKPIVIFLNVPAIEVSEALAAVRWNISVPLLFSLLTVGLILYVISRKLAGPLQQMNRAALELAGGDFTVRVPVTSKDEIGELASSFNFMVDQLVNWEDARQEFLANVSHELRSPLTSLRGLIIAMNDKIIPEDKYGHYLKICDYEVQRLQRLVNDLLDLARIQNGMDVFLTYPMDIVGKTREVLDLIKPTLADKKITLLEQLPEETYNPIVSDLDDDRFAQILQNLLHNAIQFTPSGGTITVRVCEEDGNGTIYILDTGIGISGDELQRIWERFYKAEHSRISRSEGTGLGLTIVKHLVNGMKGTIEVASEVGVGTEFKLSFPLSEHEGA
ncbi:MULTISPECIES: cell wall metabolism sensor histidine kinase WalK [Paenibacillus]|jgi:signal transduction histidine kinase|uniref:histidine kinase n=1 Tax=Paenibacillus baimaensis TaxID=2982185 RepID=A0ABT2UTW6_9BACL|nr:MULTISPECIES: HAMP domain-containing sensor histidine kinase [unclassified Paenibacillus]MCU6798106.1 HAMP domain-containing histidine kinase [Paenibacillus sp. WQ 127069]OMF19853.1 two-component sensor histidine kinase [Paenibacillus sp. FSL H7-0331]